MIEKKDRKFGNLTVELKDPKNNLLKGGTILINELKERGDFYTIKNENGKISTDLPEGVYNLQVVVEGYVVKNSAVTISSEKDKNLSFNLKTGNTVERLTVIDKLIKYGITTSEMDKPNLIVKSGQVVELPNDDSFQTIKINTIEELRYWIGSNGWDYNHDHPKYGELPQSKELINFAKLEKKLNKGEIENKEFKKKLLNLTQNRSFVESNSNRETLSRYAREYIHGNAKAVSAYAPLLNKVFESQYTNGVTLKVLTYDSILIEPEGELKIDPSVNVLYVEDLKIHKNGSIIAQGGKFEIGNYEEYE